MKLLHYSTILEFKSMNNKVVLLALLLICLTFDVAVTKESSNVQYPEDFLNKWGKAVHDTETENENYKVSVKEVYTCEYSISCPSGHGFELTVEDKRKPERKNLKFSGRISEINDLIIYHEKLVLIGSEENTDVISVIKLPSLEIIDKFRMYNPVLSRKNRYIAYRRFYPRFGDKPGGTVILLYDLQKSPQENRIEEVRGDYDPTTIQKGSPTPFPEKVGVPIFPPANYHAQKVDWSLKKSSSTYSVGKLFWDDTTAKLAFLTFKEEPKRRYKLTLFLPEEKIENSRLIIKSIDLEKPSIDSEKFIENQ